MNHRHHVALLAALPFVALGCNAILGTFEVATDVGATPDATPGVDATAGDDAIAPDAGVDARTEDAGADTAPPALPCAVPGSDGGTLAYPGDPCNFDGDMNPVPTLGACKPGKWACVDLGAGERRATCLGAVTPKPEVCTGAGGSPIDENCDGTADEGCACTNDDTRPCGQGACKGTQRCEGSSWSACNGRAPGPRKCAVSGVDNDCNGTDDANEAFCRCAGPTSAGSAPGTTALCAQFGSQNQCASRTRSCRINTAGDQAGWDAECRSGRPDCENGADNDCTNAPDFAEQACAPCVTPIGAMLPAETFQNAPVDGTSKRVVGCSASVVKLNAAGICRSDPNVNLSCKLCPATAWLAQSREMVTTGDYWMADELYSPVASNCSLTPNTAACAGGRVCASGGKCSQAGCSLGASLTFKALGCGNKSPIAGVATAGALCCCK